MSNFVALPRASRKPRAGALGSLTECPLDIRPLAGYVSSHSTFYLLPSTKEVIV